MHFWGSATTRAVSTLFKQSLSRMHFQRAVAGALPFLARQVDQQVWLSLHSLSQSWRAERHPLSFWQFWAWVEQYCWMHYWGVKTIKAVSCWWCFAGDERQPWAWAHLATLIAGWSPWLVRHRLQQEVLVPHFFWQSWRAGMHLESFWQAAHWLGHFSSMHFWGSATTRAVSTLFKQSLSRMHFQRALAGGLPFLARQVVQQVWLSLHYFSQSWRAARHPLSFWQFWAWVEQYCWMHYWGV